MLRYAAHLSMQQPHGKASCQAELVPDYPAKDVQCTSIATFTVAGGLLSAFTSATSPFDSCASAARPSCIAGSAFASSAATADCSAAAAAAALSADVRLRVADSRTSSAAAASAAAAAAACAARARAIASLGCSSDSCACMAPTVWAAVESVLAPALYLYTT